MRLAARGLRKLGRMSRSEWPLLAAVFLEMTGFGMAFPDIQLRAEVFGAPGQIIGAVLASYFVVQLLVSPAWGRLSDRVGRKPVLLVCTALSAGSMVIYALAHTVETILLSRVVAGLAAANVVAAQAYIADVNRGVQLERSMGRMSAAMLAGLVAGPAIGGFLATVGGNQLMGFAAAGCSLASLVWILFGVRSVPVVASATSEAPRLRRRSWALLQDTPGLMRFVAIAVAGWFVLACLEGTYGRLIKHNLGMGQFEFGLIFSYESLLGAAVGWTLGWLATRLGSSWMLKGGYLLQAIGLLAMPFAPGFGVLLLASTFYAFGIGVTNPTINSVCSKMTSNERQGELFGVLQAARSVGFVAGPILGGALFDVLPGLPYYVAAGVAGVAALMVVVPQDGTVPESAPG